MEENISINANTAPLLKRAFMFLEDGDWNSADKYCERVLDIDPENAQAYLGKLMAELKISKQEILNDFGVLPLDQNRNFQKAIRFANDELKSILSGYLESNKFLIANMHLEEIYKRAKGIMEISSTEEEYLEAAQLFESVSEYKNSLTLSKKCRKEAEIVGKNDVLNLAIHHMSCDDETSYIDALKLLKTIEHWKDADDRISICEQKIKEKRIIRERIELENDCIRSIAKKTRKKYYIYGSIIFSVVLVLTVSFALVFLYLIMPNLRYNKAISLLEGGKYDEALVMFTELEGYKDSSENSQKCKNVIIETRYNDATKLMEEGKFAEAEEAFAALDGYKDSADKIEEINTSIKDGEYNSAANLMNSGKYEEAIIAFKNLGTYKDSNKKIEACKEAIYNSATELEETDFISSYNYFTYLGVYKDSAQKVEAINDKHKELLAIYNANVGDYITFGSYEQDNKKKNGKEPIEWLVLAKEEDRIYVISKYILDCQEYHTSYKDVTWENSSIRKWLNGTFLKGAFTAAEKELILTTKANLDNPYYGYVSSAKATEDKIFLLGISEAFEYFSSSSSRMCAPTDYAKANGVSASDKQLVDDKGAAWYWLLSPGDGQGDAANVRTNGSVRLNGDVYTSGYYAYNVNGAVRPTMWITLDFNK